MPSRENRDVANCHVHDPLHKSKGRRLHPNGSAGRLALSSAAPNIQLGCLTMPEPPQLAASLLSLRQPQRCSLGRAR